MRYTCCLSLISVLWETETFLFVFKRTSLFTLQPLPRFLSSGVGALLAGSPLQKKPFSALPSATRFDFFAHFYSVECSCDVCVHCTKNKCMIKIKKTVHQTFVYLKNSQVYSRINHIRFGVVRLFHLDAGSQDELFWSAESLSEGEVCPAGLWQSGRGRTFPAVSTVDSRRGRDRTFPAISTADSREEVGHFSPFQQLTVGGGEIGCFPPIQQLTIRER